MRAKEPIILAAELIGEEVAEKVRAFFEKDDLAGDSYASALLDAFNDVQAELASEYIPLRKQTELETETGAVPYSLFTDKLLQIVRVTDEWDMPVRYDLYDEYFKTKSGRIKVTYTYMPKAKGTDEEIDFGLYVTKRLLAYGIAADYCLKKGLYEEAELWDKKYKESIRAAYKKAPCKKLPAREWK